MLPKVEALNTTIQKFSALLEEAQSNLAVEFPLYANLGFSELEKTIATLAPVSNTTVGSTNMMAPEVIQHRGSVTFNPVIALQNSKQIR